MAQYAIYECKLTIGLFLAVTRGGTAEYGTDQRAQPDHPRIPHLKSGSKLFIKAWSTRAGQRYALVNVTPDDFQSDFLGHKHYYGI